MRAGPGRLCSDGGGTGVERRLRRPGKAVKAAVEGCVCVCLCLCLCLCHALLWVWLCVPVFACVCLRLSVCMMEIQWQEEARTQPLLSSASCLELTYSQIVPIPQPNSACSRRRDCHSAAHPSHLSMRFDMVGEGASAEWQSRRRLAAPPRGRQHMGVGPAWPNLSFCLIESPWLPTVSRHLPPPRL